ncbi:MAG: anti-sigma factor family protein [Bacteroidota bacterium]
MTHDEYQEQISRLIDGELGEHEQPLLFAHLGTCSECRGFLNATLALRSSMASAGEIPIPHELDLRMREAVSLPSPVFPLQRAPAAFRLALAASIAFILLMGGLLFGPQMLRTQPVDAQSGIVSNPPGGQPFFLPQQN